ncbi:AAA domain-containing protein [Cephalotus follicularis]|uniref:AAA domain-containing protein n=1 Tax=Cephalotus follicularis TaxID=3775 RepID=A0A1Q3BJ14_CEPFO|nr:AAA domain-containing protein [Cephalotus follicularis]
MNFGEQQRKSSVLLEQYKQPARIISQVNSHVNGDYNKRVLDKLRGPDGQLPQRISNMDPDLVRRIVGEIEHQDVNVCWDDIAGLEHAKNCITETIVWPLLRPDIFTGVRTAGGGLLLFGPPGTGKSMIGKAIAGEANATFFNISASSLLSKWVGEAENLVRALFEVASCLQPAVIFFDEIDSLLSKRGQNDENEVRRRIKTQFFIEMEGISSGNKQILLVGATNRPKDLDEAARRRLAKRLYIALPSAEARASIVCRLLEKHGLLNLSGDDIDTICNLTGGFSGSDMENLVKDASLGPLRDAIKQGKDIKMLKTENLRPISLQDFVNSLEVIRPSVSALNSMDIMNGTKTLAAYHFRNQLEGIFNFFFLLY